MDGRSSGATLFGHEPAERWRVASYVALVTAHG